MTPATFEHLVPLHWVDGADRDGQPVTVLAVPRFDDGALSVVLSDPLSEAALFMAFASVELTLADVARFANRWGLLGVIDGSGLVQTDVWPADLAPGKRNWTNVRGGETFTLWADEIRRMRDYIALWEALRPPDPCDVDVDFLERHTRAHQQCGAIYRGPTEPSTTYSCGWGFACEKADLTDPVSRGRAVLADGVSAQLNKYIGHDLDVANGRFEILLRSSSLHGILWLQFAQSVARNSEFRKCPACGSVFVVGEKWHGRRDRDYCDSRCRSRSWRRRRAYAAAAPTA